MSHRIARVGVSALSVPALAALLLGFAVEAQSPEPPPIKMGLWQTEVTTTISGMENMPAGRGDRTTVTQGCLTPESWQSDFAKFHQGQHDADCTMSNMHQDTHGVSFDEACASGSYTTNVHFEAQFDGDNHMHGTATARMTGQAFPQGVTMNMSMASHYLSSDCGDIKPGHPRTVRE